MSLITEGGSNDGGNQDGSQQGSTSGGGQQSSSGGNTDGQPSWRDSLPDELKNDATLKLYSDVPALAKAYLSTKSMVGKKGVIVPTEKSTDEEWSSFYKNIGQPGIDKYEIKTPESGNAEVIGKFKEAAHKAGLLPKQAQAVLDWYAAQESEALKGQQLATKQKMDGEIEALKKEWGGGWDKQIAFARLAAKNFGGEDFQKYLETTGLGNDTTLVKFLAKAGASLGEDQIRGEGGGKFGQTREEILKQITDIRGNPKHAFFDQLHPGHKSAVLEMEDLYKKLNT